MIQKIIEIIARESFDSGVPAEKIMGKGRTRSAVEARRRVILKCRKETDISFSELGRFLGNRTHATIMNYSTPKNQKKLSTVSQKNCGQAVN